MHKIPYRPKPKQRIVTPEGYPFIILGIIFFIISYLFHWNLAAFILAGLTLFICFFFRNPKRQTKLAQDESLILAPADGKIIAIERVSKDPILGEPALKISTFMSVFNCHVNRLPITGFAEKIKYNPGRFFVASLDKASEQNERNALLIKNNRGQKMVVVQIAGLIARRIVCYLKEGACVVKGSRLGLIRFGSRVDVYLPLENIEVLVKLKDRVKAGKTVLGRWR
ncbi:MAG: phosphatidylserine decarboxylase family protein [Pseudomonadota bacterium]